MFRKHVLIAASALAFAACAQPLHAAPITTTLNVDGRISLLTTTLGGLQELPYTDTATDTIDTFTFADLTVPSILSIASPGTAPANIQGSIVDVNFEANVVGGSALAQFSTLTPAATPEPASLALLSTGLLGIASLVRRRTRTSL